MATRYLFNTAGEYVAFIEGNNVFSPNCDWLGFLVNGTNFYNTDGQFKGYVLNDDRIVRNGQEPARPQLARPLRPIRPLRPLKPLRRLRMPRLPSPYVDLFDTPKVEGATRDFMDAPTLDHLIGAQLIAGDGTFLGTISKDQYDLNSLSNQYGTYGNPYNLTSIFNQYGTYGSAYNPFSPFNQYTRTPPQIVKDGQMVAYLTANTFVSPRVDTEAFVSWLART